MSTTPNPLLALLPCPFCGAGETQLHVNQGTWTGMRYGEPVSVEVRHWCEEVQGQPSRMISRIGRDEASARVAWNARAALAATVAPERSPVDQMAKAVFDARWDEAAQRKGTDQAVTPEYLHWLQTQARREGFAGNEVWNAAVAWAQTQAAKAEPTAYLYHDAPSLAALLADRAMAPITSSVLLTLERKPHCRNETPLYASALAAAEAQAVPVAYLQVHKASGERHLSFSPTDIGRPFNAERWSQTSLYATPQAAASAAPAMREMLRQSRDSFERNFGPNAAADWVYGDLAGLVADPLDTQAPMELRLCESERLVLRANQNYVFTIDPACESCVRIGKAYTDPLPAQLPVGSSAAAPQPATAARVPLTKDQRRSMLDRLGSRAEGLDGETWDQMVIDAVELAHDITTLAATDKGERDDG